MAAAEWLSAVCVLATLIVAAVVAVDRNRLQRRLHDAEGRVTGLSLDLDAVRDRVAELTSYLARPGSWDVDATAPAALLDGAPVGRWTAPASSGPPAQAASATATTQDESSGDTTITKPKPQRSGR